MTDINSVVAENDDLVRGMDLSFSLSKARIYAPEDRILAIAFDNWRRDLVLGAWGCGVFGNDPFDVAALFKQALDACPGVFRKVVFAVYGGGNYDVFKSVLEAPKKN
jgi:uncharacterized protein (TIGR02452 family)